MVCCVLEEILILTWSLLTHSLPGELYSCKTPKLPLPRSYILKLLYELLRRAQSYTNGFPRPVRFLWCLLSYNGSNTTPTAMKTCMTYYIHVLQQGLQDVHLRYTGSEWVNMQGKEDIKLTWYFGRLSCLLPCLGAEDRNDRLIILDIQLDCVILFRIAFCKGF